MKFDTGSNKVASIFAIVLLLGCIISPILILLLVQLKFELLDTPIIKQRMGSLYEQIRYDNRPSLWHNVLFLFRRFLFAVVCVFC